MKKFAKLLLILLSLSNFAQSPWTPKKGKTYAQLSFTSISGYNRLFGNSDYSTEREISDRTLQFFAEHGLSNNTSLLVSIPFKMIETGDLDPLIFQPEITTSDSRNTLGNIEIGLKHNFYKKNWVLSGQLSLEANTSSYDHNSGIRTGYDAWSLSPYFIAGKGFGYTYIQAFIGANLRTNNYSSNFRIGGEIGRKLGKYIWLIGFLDVSSSFKNGDIILPIENTLIGLYVNDQEFGAFGFKAIGEISNNFGINAGFGGAFSGNNVAKAPAVTFGFYHKF